MDNITNRTDGTLRPFGVASATVATARMQTSAPAAAARIRPPRDRLDV